MDCQLMDYNITYTISDYDVRMHSEVNLEDMTYRQKCTELLQTILIEDLKKIFKLNTSRYSTPLGYNLGTFYTITIKI